MTDTLILPSRREHLEQSVDKDIEQLRGRDAFVALSASFGARRTVALC